MLRAGILPSYNRTWLFPPKEQQDAMGAVSSAMTLSDGDSEVGEMSVRTHGDN